KAVIGMFRHWTLTGFYVLCELWGSIVLSVLFWSFANEITKIAEAPRFYSVMSIGSNTAAIIAGQVAVIFSTDSFSPAFFGNNAWEQSLIKLVSLVIVSGIIMLISFSWMQKNVLNDPGAVAPERTAAQKAKQKLGFIESLRYVARSKYLLAIAALVISYNLVICLVEIIWKEQLHELKPKPQDYNIYINNLSSYGAIISTAASLLMVGILSRFGWTKTALLTPLVLLVTAIAFFACLLADNSLSPILSVFLGTTPLAIAVFLGSVQNCFSKAAKYSLFDATKEMAFIPLSPEHKLKGKAAIDGIGSRLGKSGGSCIHQGLYLLFCSLTASAPYVAIILLAVIVVWIIAVLSLGKQFEEVSRAHKELIPEEAEELIQKDNPTPSPTELTPAISLT
ncbi:MAG: ntt 2, partial [Chlamydiia bacterium]|nr:ntt 2 [Chlamydiia bacterium]